MGSEYKGIKVALGRNVRALRLRREWSQEVLAENAGLNRGQISEIELANGNPSVETITKLALALQVKPGELLDGQFR
jgi:transcriptional regulator with XRE-family HTH domain